MVMGGLGEEHSVMKLVLGQNNWYSVPPMSFPRVQVMMAGWYLLLAGLVICAPRAQIMQLIQHFQHGCTAVTLNGRPGVVVSGGVDGNQFNTTRLQEVAIIIAQTHS